MDQVKQCSQTLLDPFFQPSLATKSCKSNKGLDSPMPRLSTNDQSYVTWSSKIGESHYLCSDEKLSVNSPPSK